MEHKKAPCRDCTEETGRKPGCHSHCEEYKEWKQYLEEKKAVIAKQKEEDFWQSEHREKLAKRFMNRKKWRPRKYER